MWSELLTLEGAALFLSPGISGGGWELGHVNLTGRARGEQGSFSMRGREETPVVGATWGFRLNSLGHLPHPFWIQDLGGMGMGQGFRGPTSRALPVCSHSTHSFEWNKGWVTEEVEMRYKRLGSFKDDRMFASSYSGSLLKCHLLRKAFPVASFLYH